MFGAQQLFLPEDGEKTPATITPKLESPNIQLGITSYQASYSPQSIWCCTSHSGLSASDTESQSGRFPQDPSSALDASGVDDSSAAASSESPELEQAVIMDKAATIRTSIRKEENLFRSVKKFISNHTFYFMEDSVYTRKVRTCD